MSLVTYRTADNEIIGISDGCEPASMPGCATFEAESSSIDPKRQKHCDGQIIDKTPEEIRLADLPTAFEVQNLVQSELFMSDAYFVPDRPVSDADKAAWTSYRKALRDLSKGDPRPTAAQMIEAFPARPNGADMSVILKSRL